MNNFDAFCSEHLIEGDKKEEFFKHIVGMGMKDDTISEISEEWDKYQEAAEADESCDGDASAETIEPELMSFCKEREMDFRNMTLFVGYIKSQGYGARTPTNTLLELMDKFNQENNYGKR